MSEIQFFCKSFDDLFNKELYEILRVRQEVFVVEQKILYVDCDGKDQHALHCFAVDGTGSIIAYLRIIYPGHKFKEAAIGRVLTTSAGRGKGLGKAIMKFALAEAAKRFGNAGVRISAQQYLQKFYQDLGFTPVSEPYEEEGIAHIEMLYSPDQSAVTIEKLQQPFRIPEIAVAGEQQTFITPVAKVLGELKSGAIPFIIRKGGVEAGFFCLRHSEDDEVEQLRAADRCTLTSFMVDAKHQGRGIAKDALRALPGLARQTFPSVKSIGLTVNYRNTHACALYEKNGFVKTNEPYLGGSAGPQHVMILEIEKCPG